MSEINYCCYCKESNITSFYKDNFCSKSCFNEYTIEQLFSNNVRKKHYTDLKNMLLDNTCSCSSIEVMKMKHCSNCERYICIKCCTRPCFMCSFYENETDTPTHGCKMCLKHIKYKETEFVILLCDNCNKEYEDGLFEF